VLSLEALAARIHLLRTGVQSCPCAPKTQGEVETQSRFHNFHGDRITHGGEGHPVYGVTNQKGGFALLSEDGRAEDMKTMPHEIGRYFGTLGKGSLYDDNNSSEELLMCQGEGDSTKVLRLSRKSWGQPRHQNLSP